MAKVLVDWQEFEKLSLMVYQGLTRHLPDAVIDKNVKLTGKSGSKHEIDVFMELGVGLNKYKTAISCKYYKRHVGLEKVRDFRGVLEDLDINKGIMISKGGFTKPALQYALAQGLELMTLKKPEVSDVPWPGRGFRMILIPHIPVFRDFLVQVDDENLKLDSLEARADEILLQIPGQKAMQLNSWVQKLLQNQKEEKEWTLVKQSFLPGTKLKSPKQEMGVNSISFEFKFYQSGEAYYVDGEGIVDHILQNLQSGKVIPIHY